MKGKYAISILISLILAFSVISATVDLDFLEIIDLKLNGKTQVVVSPGEIIDAMVKVKIEGPNNSTWQWKSVKYIVFNDDYQNVKCFNLDTPFYSGNEVENFNVAAPTNVGTYDFQTRVYYDLDCNDKEDYETLIAGIIVQIEEPKCGDGEINQPWEDCDDNNNESGDGCSATCENEEPIIIPEIDPELPYCEDDLKVCAEIVWPLGIDSVEMYCIAGDIEVEKILTLEETKYCGTLSNETLEAEDDLFIECTITANYGEEKSASVFINTTYDCPECGNTEVEIDEVCDEGSLNGILCEAGYESFCKYCTTECIWERRDGPKCGDNICQPEYEEDWMNCNEDCFICGDGVVNGGDICDLGDNNSIDCDPEYDSSCAFCHAVTCEWIIKEGAFCGDNNVDDGEICDDGNTEDGDGCSSKCKVEPPKRRYSSHSELECVANWTCTNWGPCIGDVRSRECTDWNYCEYAYNLPIETQGCEIILDSKIDEKSNYFKFWLLLPGFLLVTLIVLLLLPKK